MTPVEVNKARILRWIESEGGEISRNRLRRYRPRKSAWEPIEVALLELIESGRVRIVRNDLEPLERGCGRATTRYQITEHGNSATQ
jgi:hypothetical protein